MKRFLVAYAASGVLFVAIDLARRRRPQRFSVTDLRRVTNVGERRRWVSVESFSTSSDSAQMVASTAQRATAGDGPDIDVLAFPPDQAELRRRQTRAAERWRELERRARVALFFGAGMFLAWAADVGAAFELGHAGGSALFGMASVPIAIVVALAHLYGRWALERATRGRAEVQQRYAHATLREAAPLLDVARNDAVVAQYLRCVGRQRRALSTVERVALHTWAQGRQEAAHSSA